MWITERFSPYEAHSHKIRKKIIQLKTKYQDLMIVDSYTFKRCLFLDNEIQSAQLDEFIYHEALVHPAMIIHPAPKKILILGGGEGATAREVLKHKTVEEVKMVDIDEEVINICKRYLAKWHSGVFSNPKLKLHIADSWDFIYKKDEKYDVIISDLPSPLKGGSAYHLYTIEFYRMLSKRLNDKGIFVLQACSGSLPNLKVHVSIYQTLKKVFPFLRSYYIYVPSFDDLWGFIICSFYDSFKNFSMKRIEKRINDRIRGDLRFYDGESHIGLFNIPKYLREALNRGGRIISRRNPIYFYK